MTKVNVSFNTKVNFNKEDFQKEIIEKEGFLFSDGTLNNLHLLPKAYDIIKGYNMHIDSEKARTITEDILKCFKGDVKPDQSLYMQQYYSEIELKSYNEMMEEHEWNDNDLWYEDIHNFFNEISPNGFYFGSCEGDGACIGWFKFENEDITEEDDENEV